MNCCNKDQANEKKASHKGHGSHLLMMVLCCGLPVVILLLLPTIGTLIPGSAKVIGSIAPFLCPIMMMIMMPMMMRGNKDKQTGNEHSEMIASENENNILSGQ